MKKLNRYLRQYELDLMEMRELESELFNAQEKDMYFNNSNEIKRINDLIGPLEFKLRRRSLYFIEELQNNTQINDSLIEDILEALSDFIPEIEYDIIHGLPINYKTIKIHKLN